MLDFTEDSSLPSENSRTNRIFHALDLEGTGALKRQTFLDALRNTGLMPDDPRLSELMSAFHPADGEPLTAQQFSEAISSVGVLVERALQGKLIIPDFAGFQRHMESLCDEVGENRAGKPADYIPPLATVNPEQFGTALVTVDGQQMRLGDAQVDFSIQSTCKPFNYCFALEELGEETVHGHIGREPSGRGFNAYVLQEDNRPHNPMINAGAIMCASLIKQNLPTFKRLRHVTESWRALTGGTTPRFNAYMAMEEDRTGDRNRALAYMMKNEEAFPGGEDFEDANVRSTLELYFKTCSLEMNAQEMAMAAATLANGGVNPMTGERALKRSTVRNCLSLMYSCGMYDFSGEFAFSIGVPAKSGVGGAVILVVPGLFGMCIWSPRLDRIGNSVRGVDLATRLLRDYALHVFDGDAATDDRIDLRVPRARWRAGQTAEALWASSTGDLSTLRRLAVGGFCLQTGDYDGRTALHLAAAEGHIQVVQYLLHAGVDPNTRDRWGGTALDDAKGHDHSLIIEVLESAGGEGGESSHGESTHNDVSMNEQQGDPVEVMQLLWASAKGQLANVVRLVARGASVNATDYDGRTALHLAAAEGQVELVRYLITHGASRTARDRWGATPRDGTTSDELAELLEPSL